MSKFGRRPFKIACTVYASHVFPLNIHDERKFSLLPLCPSPTLITIFKCSWSLRRSYSFTVLHKFHCPGKVIELPWPFGMTVKVCHEVLLQAKYTATAINQYGTVVRLWNISKWDGYRLMTDGYRDDDMSWHIMACHDTLGFRDHGSSDKASKGEILIVETSSQKIKEW